MINLNIGAKKISAYYGKKIRQNSLELKLNVNFWKHC